MKTALRCVVVLIGLVAMLGLVPAGASASGSCSTFGSRITCSGTTDGRYVAGSYLPGHFAYDSRLNGGWVEGYWQEGYWQPGYYYSFSCDHFGGTWTCTQIVPTYATWTVND